MSKVFFGRKLIQAQADHFIHTPPISRLLVLGGGTGHFLPDFFPLHPDARVEFVDLSDGMLKQARQNLAGECPHHFDQVFFQKLDIEHELKYLTGNYDAVLLPFVLDCLSLDQIRRVLHDLRGLIAPGGTVYLTDFSIPDTPGFQQTSYQALVQAMYLFFHVVTDIPFQDLPDFKALFTECGYHLVEDHSSDRELIMRQTYRLNP
ncbi:class I SAM-dependent methyltransferase [bacterium SCSIO 12741]|nr:class I SAM-dependent methyltransferase [bacterium SCSIO 12741]